MIWIISNSFAGLGLSALAISLLLGKHQITVGIGKGWDRLIHILLSLGVLAYALLYLAKAYYLYTAPEDKLIKDCLEQLSDIVLFSFVGMSLLYHAYQRYHKEPIEISFGSKPRTLMKYGFYTGIRAALGVILLVWAISELIEFCSI